jgi:hypothetical protein
MGQVCLVVEANVGSHVGQRLTGENAIAGRLEPSPDHVRMWRDPEHIGEGVGKLRRTRADLDCGCGHRDLLKCVGIEERAKMLGQNPAGRGGPLFR